MTDTPDRVRDGAGRYDRNPLVAAKDAQAATLRARSYTYQQIADTLGMGHKKRAHEAVARALADTLTEPAEAVRTMELEKLDAIERGYLEIIERRHAVLYQGEDTGFEDDGPTLTALAGLVRVSESRRKFLGLDAPTKVDLGTTVTYKIDGVDMDALR